MVKKKTNKETQQRKQTKMLLSRLCPLWMKTIFKCNMPSQCKQPPLGSVLYTCAEKNRKGDIGGGVGNRDPPKLANGLFVLHRGLMRIAEARECKREREIQPQKKPQPVVEL